METWERMDGKTKRKIRGQKESSEKGGTNGGGPSLHHPSYLGPLQHCS